tara:strand:+ start:242 stop:352 length:111 start_codon:yes stop_codon:yes gene_type:complete
LARLAYDLQANDEEPPKLKKGSGIFFEALDSSYMFN